MKLLITGGSGFIGSNLIHYIINNTDHTVINIDNLNYCTNDFSLASLNGNNRYHFYKGDINNTKLLENIVLQHNPDSVLHLAAESHVDRSIDRAKPFIESNILGTYNLLEIFTKYWSNLPLNKKDHFRFIHISTDEVYGSLGNEGSFTESTPYAPSSPYSASKASSDHLVRAWNATYQFPTIISNCSNNFGPYQFPEKLIPVIILNALQQKTIPIYGNGENVRNWLFVEDHVKALLLLLEKGTIGESYNIGSDTEISNLAIAKLICETLDKKKQHPTLGSYKELIQFVSDRPGHDYRYSVDYTKIKNQLGWIPQADFTKNLSLTIDWYLKHPEWIEQAKKKHNVSTRLGTKTY
jgi:dTDP-glucose 4,6-dehydratase